MMMIRATCSVLCFSTLHIIIIKFHTSFFCRNLLSFDPWFAFPIITHLLHKIKHEENTSILHQNAEISRNKVSDTHAHKTKESNNFAYFLWMCWILGTFSFLLRWKSDTLWRYRNRVYKTSDWNFLYETTRKKMKKKQQQRNKIDEIQLKIRCAYQFWCHIIHIKHYSSW